MKQMVEASFAITENILERFVYVWVCVFMFVSLFWFVLLKKMFLSNMVVWSVVCLSLSLSLCACVCVCVCVRVCCVLVQFWIEEDYLYLRCDMFMEYVSFFVQFCFI
jgi:hypothetical protein